MALRLATDSLGCMSAPMVYANPVTQARSLPLVFPSNIYSFIKVTLLGFVCFMCPGTVTTFHDD